MRTAKLFIDGSEYRDNVLLDYSCLEHSVSTYLYNFVDLSEYNDGDSFEWHAENESGEVIIRGMATVNFTPSVTVKVDDD